MKADIRICVMIFFFPLITLQAQSSKSKKETKSVVQNKIIPIFELKGKILFDDKPLSGVTIKLVKHPDGRTIEEAYQTSKDGDYNIKIKYVNYHDTKSSWMNQYDVYVYVQKTHIKNKHIIFDPHISEKPSNNKHVIYSSYQSQKIDSESYVFELPIEVKSDEKKDTLDLDPTWDNITIAWSSEKQCFVSWKFDWANIVKKNLTPEVGRATTFKNVFFEKEKNQLLPKSFDELDKLVNYLKADPKTIIEISGHTDSTGNEVKNKALSESRAKSVADYLISKGIEKSRISYKGYGSGKPIASNATEAGREQNRRVEFVIQKK